MISKRGSSYGLPPRGYEPTPIAALLPPLSALGSSRRPIAQLPALTPTPSPPIGTTGGGSIARPAQQSISQAPSLVSQPFSATGAPSEHNDNVDKCEGSACDGGVAMMLRDPLPSYRSLTNCSQPERCDDSASDLLPTLPVPGLTSLTSPPLGIRFFTPW